MTEGNGLELCGRVIAPGEWADLNLTVSHSYSGLPVNLPIHVRNAPEPGPAVLITAAVHGDELNGTGIVRELTLNPPFELVAGALVLVPVVNMLGFDRHTRYLPDRRDLNRCFPGSPEGSLARRFARTFFDELVSRCDYGIDLHTAAVRRTNFPNIRADMSDPQVARIARAFGCEVLVNGKGPIGSLRRAACKTGCKTVILEAGEVWKIEPTIVEYGVRGIRNVLIELGMVEGKRLKPHYQVRINRTKWIRADDGGMLQFHVAPGDLVALDQPIATNSNLLGREQHLILSPAEGIILGMTTLPVVTPGDPICHLAIPDGDVSGIRRAIRSASSKSLLERLREDLSTNVFVSEPMEVDPPPPNDAEAHPELTGRRHEARSHREAQDGNPQRSDAGAGADGASEPETNLDSEAGSGAGTGGEPRDAASRKQEN